MENVQVPNNRALVRLRPADYEEQLFWLMFQEFGRLEMETGLPWIRGFQMALFRVTVAFVKRERAVELHDLDTMTNYLRWMWTMLAFGASLENETDPARVSHAIAIGAQRRVEQKLGQITVTDDLERLLAEEIVIGWRPYFEKMRTARALIHAEMHQFIKSIEAHPHYTFHLKKVKASQVNIQVPMDRDERFFSAYDRFFLPIERTSPTIDDLYSALSEFRWRMAYVRALLILPINIDGLPNQDPVGMSAKADIVLEENWLRTQILLAGIDADTQREMVPWHFELFLKKLEVRTPAALAAKFWKRMADRKMKPLNAHQKALIEAKVLDRAKSVLEQRAFVARGGVFDDAGRMSLFVIAPVVRRKVKFEDPPADAVAEWDGVPIVAVEAWMNAYPLAQPMKHSVKRALEDFDLMTIEGKRQVLLAFADHAIVRGHRRLNEIEQRLISGMTARMIELFITHTDPWASEVITSLSNLIEEWTCILCSGQHESQVEAYIERICAVVSGIHKQKAYDRSEYVFQLFDVAGEMARSTSHTLLLNGDDERADRFQAIFHKHRDEWAIMCFYAALSHGYQNPRQLAKVVMVEFSAAREWILDALHHQDERLFEERLSKLIDEYCATIPAKEGEPIPSPKPTRKKAVKKK